MDTNDSEWKDFEARCRATGLPMGSELPYRETIRAGDIAKRSLMLPVTVAAPATLSGVGKASEEPTVPGALPRISLAALSITGNPNPAASFKTDLLIVRRLGEGGMGTVDLAQQRSLARDVAIKRLREGPMDARHAAALLHEARTTGRLEHPGVVPVHALGVDDEGRPVLVMKRIEGVSWAELVADPEHAFWSKLAFESHDRLGAHLDILRQVCNALQFAHKRGVIHRDIKPENVMIGEFGEVYLLDWGVALERDSLTDAERESAQLVGTPCFMPPEMFGGRLEDQDERSDVYLLGATLHAVLTGRARHEGGSLQEVMLAAYNSAPVIYPPEIPEELAALCNEATDRDRTLRPASAEAFRRRLAQYMEHRGSMALVRRAREALARSQIVADPASASAGATKARVLLSEAHFGFQQALREWPDNQVAREGLQACMEALVERELAMRSPDSVRELLDDLPVARPELAARLAKLEREIAGEKVLAERGRVETREMDKSISAGARTIMIGAGVGVSVLSGVVAIRREKETGRSGSIQETLGNDAALLLVVAVALVLGRRHLFGNRVSRQLTLTLVVMLVVGCFADVVTWHNGGDPQFGAAHGFVAGAGALAVGGFTVDRDLLVPMVVLLTAALLMLAWPAAMGAVSTGAALLVALSLIRTAWRHGRKDDPAE